MRLQTLNLDFSTSLSSFQEDCFACMPSLMFLSLCETRILNLWTTIAALSKLPSLVELRFQHWSCCNDVGPYSASSSGNFHHKTYSNQRNIGRASSVNIGELTDLYSSTEEVLRNMFLLNNVVINDDESGLEDSDDSDLDFTSPLREHGYMERLSNDFSGGNGQINQQNEVITEPFQ